MLRRSIPISITLRDELGIRNVDKKYEKTKYIFFKLNIFILYNTYQRLITRLNYFIREPSELDNKYVQKQSDRAK